MITDVFVSVSSQPKFVRQHGHHHREVIWLLKGGDRLLDMIRDICLVVKGINHYRKMR